MFADSARQASNIGRYVRLEFSLLRVPIEQLARARIETAIEFPARCLSECKYTLMRTNRKSLQLRKANVPCKRTSQFVRQHQRFCIFNPSAALQLARKRGHQSSGRHVIGGRDEVPSVERAARRRTERGERTIENAEEKCHQISDVNLHKYTITSDERQHFQILVGVARNRQTDHSICIASFADDDWSLDSEDRASELVSISR